MNPVLKNEMKLMGRSRQMVIIVTVFNLIMSGAILLIFDGLQMMQRESGSSPWTNVSLAYAVIITLEICMLTLFVPPIASGSIAGEYEHQTMDILLTSRMNTKTIIKGKLLSSVSLALLLMVSCLPVNIMVLTFGGLTFMMMIKSILYAAFFAFMAGSIGVLCSAILRRTTGATIATYGIILLMTIGTLALEVVISLLSEAHPWLTAVVYLLFYLLLLNPALTFSVIVTQIFSGFDLIDRLSVNIFVPQFLMQHWVFASLIVQIIFSLILLRAAERKLDPLSKRR